MATTSESTRNLFVCPPNSGWPSPRTWWADVQHHRLRELPRATGTLALRMKGNDIRRLFLRFFEERGHRVVPSSSLIAPPETGLLLTTAGMVQFIPYFLGYQDPPY